MQKAVIDIVNIVSISYVQDKIDLAALVQNAQQTVYRPFKFPGAVLKIQNPKSTALIFSSGKIICAGNKSAGQTTRCVEKVLSVLEGAGCRTHCTRTSIENIVASVNYGRQIDLQRCAKILPKSIYEPEHFPAVFHKMGSPPATLLIYKTGKIICTGLNAQDAVVSAAVRMGAILAQMGLFC